MQVSIWCGFSSLWFFSSKIRQAGAVLRPYQAAKVLCLLKRKKPEDIGLWGERARRCCCHLMVPEVIPAETQLPCYFLIKYSFPGTQSILTLDLEGKESRQIPPTPHLAFEHSAGKGRQKSGWVWECPSSLPLSGTSQWCNILPPSSHIQTELLGFACMPVCVIFGSPSTRRGLAREWVQSSNCGHRAIQRGRKWAFLPEQTSGHSQSDCQEITG